MRGEDLYGVLGVKRSADEKEIKKAYRRLARELHPDHNRGDKSSEEKFKRVSAAYAVLGDKEKRRLYDQYGIDGLRDGFDPAQWQRYGAGSGQPFGGAGGEPGRADFDLGGFSGFGSLEDIFESLFGGAGFRESAAGRRHASQVDAPMPGAQVRSVMEIDLLDAVIGRELQIVVPIEGERKKLKVKVPRGIDDGQTMRLKGQGASGHGRVPSGDLLLEISTRKHPRYRREGDDLIVGESITFAQAYKGASVPVETPWGRVVVTVPAGTQGGQRLRVKGHGVRREMSAGDLLVDLAIRVPTNRSEEGDRAADLLEQLY